jgi:hypothetical protein
MSFILPKVWHSVKDGLLKHLRHCRDAGVQPTGSLTCQLPIRATVI